MTFILAVGSADYEQITEGQHVTIAGFMREDTEGGHVQLPDDVCCSVVFEDFFPIWTIVLTIAETLRVEATELTLSGDVVQTVAFNIRSTCRRRQQELP
jgi:hypothetical protein